MGERTEDMLAHLGRWAEAEAPRLGLAAGRLVLDRVLSRGGFGAWTLRARDGARTVYLKAVDGDGADALARWADAAESLEAAYHAPHLLACWPVGVVAPGVAVVATEGVEGRPLTAAGADRVLPAVLLSLASLHENAALAARLGLSQRPVSLREAFRNALGERLSQDLFAIERRVDRLPLPVRGRVGVLRDAAAELARAVRQDAAFSGTTTAPTHGDPHWHNILVARGGATWHLLDWDDLAIGDPAMDLAVVLFRWRMAHGLARRAPWPRPAVDDRALVRRVGVYTWASVLDLAIDSLADAVEAQDWVRGNALEASRRYFVRRHEEGWRLLARWRPKDLFP